MRVYQVVFGLIVIISLATGCEMLKTKEDHVLFHSISEVLQQIDNEDWDRALSQVNHLKEQYEQRKWKLQLLGNLEDYKEIELELVALRESLQEQDKLESRIALTEIRQRLQMIYTL